MIPKEASQTINEAEVWRNLGNYSPPSQSKRKAPKFSLGDKIRITRKKEPSRKDIHHNGLRKYLQFQKSPTRIRLPMKLWTTTTKKYRAVFYEPELQKATQELLRIQRL